MKKKLWTFMLTLSLVLPNTAIAKNINLDEIVLDNTQPYVETGHIAGEAAPMLADAASKEVPLVNKAGSTSEKASKKGFFSVFNLKGGIEKAAPSTTSAEISKPEASAEIEKTVVRQWLDGDYATGKWFGARPLLSEHGVTINSSLLYSPVFKTGGGVNDAAGGKGYSLFNLSVTVDTEKAGMWKGGTFFTLYQKKTGYGLAGMNESGAMGDFMGFDSWDARQLSQISECWYQQKLFNNKLRLKFGKQDANNDFGYLNSGWNFMNLAFSVNPSVLMPTYPDPAFGFVAEVNPKEWLSIRNGTYSRYSNPFNITELEVKPKIKNLPGRYMVGAWEMSNNTGWDIITGISPTSINYTTFYRDYGGYAAFEQMVYKENKNDDNDMQGLVVFGQAGMSPTDRNAISKYVGGGLTYTGLIPKRDKDILGVGIANGAFAPRLSNLISMTGSETAFECFYRAQITPWFYLQPDVQFISNPSGYYNNSVAIGLRTVITF